MRKAKNRVLRVKLQAMSEGNPYESPKATRAASRVARNTLPRLIGIALYPIAAVAGLLALPGFLGVASRVSQGDLAELLYWPPPVGMLFTLIILPLVIWHGPGMS